MAASDSDEFESADEDYEYKERKTTLKKSNNNEYIKDVNETNIQLTNLESKPTVESEHDKKNAFSAIDETEDGWDDFGEEEWINTIPEINKIELNKANENSSSNIPILDKPALTSESFSENLTDKVTELNKKNEVIPILQNIITQSFTENSCDKIEEVTTITEKSSEENEASSSWSGWKPWGGIMSSVFSAASEGVTTLTTLIETGIGAPNPETLVKINKKNEVDNNVIHDESIKTNKSQDTMQSLGNLVSGVTNIGNKVITGGLDTLEGIGKKTMNILQENDPLLLQKRKFMGLESERPILSQVLREAKEKSEEVEKNLKQMQKQAYKKQLHFESLFDNYYGLVHLEALEMLSKQAAIKLQSLLEPLSGKALTEMKETLNEVSELCDLGDLDINDTQEPFTYENLQENLESAIEDLGIEISFKDILQCWKKNIEELDNSNFDSNQIYEKGLRCLAETCALQITKMHKIAELLIIREHHSTANEADSLVQMTTIFCYHSHGIANKFCRKFNTFEQNEELSALITNLFLEVYNSTSYVQSAFKLFIPILQVGAA